jgi:hypothetical protein
MDGVRPLPSSMRIGITFGIAFSTIFSIMAVKRAFCQTAKYPYGINDSLEKKLKSGLNRFFLAAGFN